MISFFQLKKEAADDKEEEAKEVAERMSDMNMLGHICSRVELTMNSTHAWLKSLSNVDSVTTTTTNRIQQAANNRFNWIAIMYLSSFFW